MKRAFALTGAFLICALLVGCGGGSGGGGSRAFGLYLSDSFRDDYDQVWVTIYQVDLIDPSGSVQNAFSDPAGRQVNVRTLHDATGPLFLMLDLPAVSPHTTQKVRVT